MSTAIVLICDRDFIVPTIGVAVSARLQTSGEPSIRVVVFVTDLRDSELRAVQQRAELHGISVRAARLPDLATFRECGYTPTHASAVMFGRLWLDDLLEPEITRFLYLDGDLDITGPLAPLLTMEIPKGGFLAAPETPMLVEGERGNIATKNREYLEGLGLSAGAEYFNTGVLLVDRSGWGDLSRQARDFFLSHVNECRWHDQSALNAVAGQRRGALSPVWNYNTDFMAVVDPRLLGYTPAIWHFTGVPKPWHGSAFPWSDAFGRSFRLGAGLLAGLGLEGPAPSHAELEGTTRSRDADRFRLAVVYPWRRVTRSVKIYKALAGDAVGRRPHLGRRPDPPSLR